MAALVMRGIWWALLAAALPWCAGCAGKLEDRVVAVPDLPDVSREQPLPELAARMAHSVTADTLYTVYSLNLIQGATPDQRFLNRPLLVTGVFNGTNIRTLHRTFLELRTHDDGAFVYAQLGIRAQPLLATLTPGQRVSLLCRGAGALSGSPILMNCRPE